MIVAKLLGPLDLTIDGKASVDTLTNGAALALSAILWLSPNQTATRAELCRLLKGEEDSDDGTAALDLAHRDLLQLYGADAVVSQVESKALHWAAPIEFDLAAFQAAESAGLLDQAAALIRGPLLADFSLPGAQAFGRWLASQRISWGERLVMVLETLSSNAEDAGELETALTLAGRAFKVDPGNGGAARALIRSRWLLGDRAGALEDGRRHGRYLKEERRAQPDALTQALILRVAGGRSPRIHVEATPNIRRPPFYGRYPILSRSLAITREVNTLSRPALIVLSGETGTGRSRLMEEVVLRATLEGETVAVSRTVEADSDDPYALWLGLASGGLLDAPSVGEAPTAVLAGIAARSAEWAERFPVTQGATGLPLSDAVTGIIRSVAMKTPLLLAVDDAHRLGVKGLSRITRLLRDLSGVPVTLLVTLESSSNVTVADEIRRAAERITPGSSMKIDPWELGEVNHVVNWALPEWDELERTHLARRIHKESDGRPSIAIELLAAISQGLPLDLDTGTWPVPGTVTDKAMEMLGAFGEAIRLSYERLSEEEHRLLGAAALLPEPSTRQRLARIAELENREAVETMLDRLEWECWLVADGRGYSFPSTAVRGMITTSLLTDSLRKRLTTSIQSIAGI